jgi:hemerythrin superfamily protein
MAVAIKSVIHRAKVQLSPDVVTLLKADHKEVNALFLAVNALGERAYGQRFKLANKICKALEVHSNFEKSVLYAGMKGRVKNHDGRELVLESFEEHGIVDRLVREIKELNPRDETLQAKLQVLMENVQHHVKEEEGELFPKAREVFEKEELVEMGRRFMEMKGRTKPEKA